MLKLSGSWQGIYYIESKEPENIISIRFNMSIIEKNGEFTGKCQDLGEQGIPELASINGFVEENMISFIKTYSCHWFLNDEGEIQKDESKPHPEIHYNGIIEANRIQGTWEFVINPMQYRNGYFEEYYSGKWEMTKKK